MKSSQLANLEHSRARSQLQGTKRQQGSKPRSCQGCCEGSAARCVTAGFGGPQEAKLTDQLGNSACSSSPRSLTLQSSCNTASILPSCTSWTKIAWFALHVSLFATLLTQTLAHVDGAA